MSQHTSVPAPDNAACAAAKARRDEVNTQAPIWNLVARVLRMKTDERARHAGATGAEQVGRELSSLPDGWNVLHAVSVGDRGRDIDHLVIGPGGVWALNTKCHPDGEVWLYEHAVWVDGQLTHHLRHSRFEAERASELLTAACAMTVGVQPAIVFVDLTKLVVRGMPTDVRITTATGLRKFLTQQPHQLTQADVDHICMVARNGLASQSARGHAASSH